MTILPDLHRAIRSLGRAPGFLAGALACLALGLGANAVLFNTAQALLWRPLAFQGSDRVVSSQTRVPTGQEYSQVSPGLAALLRERTGAFSEVGLARELPDPIVVNPQTEGPELGVGAVNPDYLQALSLRPLLGRFFTEEEILAEARSEAGPGIGAGAGPGTGTGTGEGVALITEGAWRGAFGADPGILGRSVPTLSQGRLGRVRILGVVPGGATLPFLSKAQLLIPGPASTSFDGSYDGNLLYKTVLRLKPGLGRPQAQARVQAALSEAEGSWPGEVRGTRLNLEPLLSVLAPVNPKAILLLYAAAVLLLILTCANAASLFLDRALGRARDAAIRLALGASLWQILKSTLLESLLVAGAGSLLALGLERLARPLVLEQLPDLRALGPELLHTGGFLLAFCLFSGLAVALAVALLATLQARRPSLMGILADGGSRGSSSATPWRSFLVVAQVAIILVLLTVGSLVGRSFVQALRADPGFEPKGVIAFQATPIGEGPAWKAAAFDTRNLILELPGTAGVAFTSESPLGERYSGAFQAGDAPPLSATYKLVGADYFETLGARLSRGRSFTEDEVRRFGPVVILNERAAAALFGSVEAVGRVIQSGVTGKEATVVGVVKDLRVAGLDREAPAVVYLPYSPFFRALSFLVRTSAKPAVFKAALQARMKALHPDVRLGRFEPLEEATGKTIQPRLLAGLLVGGFALLGLAIGAVGLYGTLSAQVRHRRREIGIRMALGATPLSIVRRFLTRGGRLVALGALAGLGGSLAAARIVRLELYEVGPLDAPSFVLALTLLLLAALLACLIPALRAARVPPAIALRCE